MGDVAEMIISGLFCQECGGLMDDHEEPGYPRSCDDCSNDGKELFNHG